MSEVSKKKGENSDPESVIYTTRPSPTNDPPTEYLHHPSHPLPFVGKVNFRPRIATGPPVGIRTFPGQYYPNVMLRAPGSYPLLLDNIRLPGGGHPHPLTSVIQVTKGEVQRNGTTASDQTTNTVSYTTSSRSEGTVVVNSQTRFNNNTSTGTATGAGTTTTTSAAAAQCQPVIPHHMVPLMSSSGGPLPMFPPPFSIPPNGLTPEQVIYHIPGIPPPPSSTHQHHAGMGYLAAPAGGYVSLHGPAALLTAKLEGKITCYNCGGSGHSGPDCKEAIIDEIAKPGKT